MPIEIDTEEYVYTGNGVTTAFPFPSLFQSSADIIVGLNGVLQTTGFTITGAGNPAGGTVTFTVAPVVAARVVLVRAPPFSQLTEFTTASTIGEGAVTRSLDKLTMIAQFLLRRSERSIRLEDLDGSVNFGALPDAATRASKVLTFDTNGLLLLSDPLFVASPLMLPATIKGRAAGAGTGVPQDLTPAQARTVIEPKLGEFTQVGAGASARTLDARLKDNAVTPEDFGAVGDGITDDRVAVLAALNSGRAVNLRDRRYACSAGIAISGRTVVIFGDSRERAGLIFTGGTAGLSVTLTAGDQFFGASGVSFLTTQAEVGGDAVRVEYTPTGFANRDCMRAIVHNCGFAGSNRTTQGWARGLVLVNTNETDLYNNFFAGRMTNGTTTNTQSEKTFMAAAVRIEGSEYPTSHTVTNCRFYGMLTGVSVAGAAEGVNVVSCTAVWARDFVSWQPTSPFGGRPQLTVLNTHANVFRSAVRIRDGVLQVGVMGNSFYHNPGSTDVGNLVDLGTVLTGVIQSNFFVSYATGSTTNGVVLGRQGGTEDSVDIIVSNNIFGNIYSTAGGNQRFTRAIWLLSGSRSVSLINNRPSIDAVGVSSCITFVQNDSGNSSLNVAGRVTRCSASGATSIANNTLVAVPFDTVVSDVAGLRTGTSSQFIIPAGRDINYVLVTANIVWDASAANRRLFRIYRGATIVAAVNDAPDAGGFPQNITAMFPVVAGDVITLEVFQNSGAALNLQGFGQCDATISVLS